MIGRKFSEHTRLKISNSLKKRYKKYPPRKHTLEERKRISEKQKGELHWNFGRNRSNETIKKIIESTSKSRGYMVYNEKTGETYISIREAERKTGIDRCTIKRCCDGLPVKSKHEGFVYLKRGDINI